MHILGIKEIEMAHKKNLFKKATFLMFHFLSHLTKLHFLGHPVCYYYTLFEYFYVSWTKGTQESEPNKL